MKHQIDPNYFPGFTRKAVTFTIDDGNIEMDKKFLSIVRPAGIIGTFNLCSPDKLSPEEYCEMYHGYEINNHVKLHPELMVPNSGYIFSEEPFDPETADIRTLYRYPGAEGVWLVNGCYYDVSHLRWFKIADTEVYNRLIDETRIELEEVFGEGSVRGFVWPFGQQVDYKGVLRHVHEAGYYGARDAGSPVKSFSLPADRLRWKYCAMDHDLLEVMEKYEALADDGELKFFSFGVHSIDYERNNTWGNLTAFCEKYGARPEEFYYSTVGDIFDYEDAMAALTVTDTELKNDSSLPLYVKIDGNPVIISPKSTYTV
ncbi:MAG: hypothetical protein IJX92_00780 [Clostridia bacterium]|nr:hypothetical protein [Clostridia bacterium]